MNHYIESSRNRRACDATLKFQVKLCVHRSDPTRSSSRESLIITSITHTKTLALYLRHLAFADTLVKFVDKVN